MTIPKIVITLDGGIIQDIVATHQVEVIVLDRDTEGADKEDLTMVAGCPAWASPWGVIHPNDEDTAWIAEVLADIAKDVRPEGVRAWPPL